MALYINGNKASGGTDIIHLTQAQYDALPSSKNYDGKVYMITDVNGDGSQFQPVIYSENEREIGVWTDGKPLYEKTFVTTSPSQDDTVEVVQDITSLNVDTPINIYGHIGNVPLNWELELNYNSCFINQAKTGIVMRVGSSLTSNISYITIQYTKTTDVAGSGTWTPQGVPAVHYGTDEQVVGTWIDGSTIYERTWQLTNSITVNGNGTALPSEITNDLTNVENIIEAKAIRVRSNDTLPAVISVYVWEASNNNYSILSSDNWTGISIITLRYTKTS